MKHIIKVLTVSIVFGNLGKFSGKKQISGRKRRSEKQINVRAKNFPPNVMQKNCISQLTRRYIVSDRESQR